MFFAPGTGYQQSIALTIDVVVADKRELPQTLGYEAIGVFPSGNQVLCGELFFLCGGVHGEQ